MIKVKILREERIFELLNAHVPTNDTVTNIVVFTGDFPFIKLMSQRCDTLNTSSKFFTTIRYT